MRNVLVLVCCAFLSVCGFSQSDSVVVKITAPVQDLLATAFPGKTVDPGSEPYKSGVIEQSQAAALIKALGGNDKITTIIHVLRWADSDHKKTNFEKWYLFDPTPSKTSFYLQSSQTVFQRTAIPGRTQFQLLFIHLNSNLAGGEDEWKQPNLGGPGATLIHNVSYTVTIAKAQTQFIQDLKTALQVAGVMSAADANTISVGYYGVGTFTSQWTTSTITVAANLDSSTTSNPAPGSSDTTAKSGSNQLSSKVYTNERPSFVGLSAGVPVTSYKDVTYQGSTGLAPSTITKQNVYFFLDGYVPPVLPSLTAFRYIPHPFFGFPIKGKVLRHLMLGGGLGLRWVEPFGGVVFDTENQQVKGSAPSTKLTLQPVFGLKVSISSVAKALKGK